LERSENGGASWVEVPMLYSPQEVVDIAFHPLQAEKVYVLQRWGGVLLSTDGGDIWESVPLDFDPAESGVELSGLSVSRDGTLFLETSAGLLRKADQVSGWQKVDFDPKKKNWAVIV